MPYRANLPRSPRASRVHAPPGSWWLARSIAADNQTDSRYATVLIKCPLCQTVATLRAPVDESWTLRADGTQGYGIMGDGVVVPSVVCPNKDCTWRVWARLVGWVP